MLSLGAGCLAVVSIALSLSFTSLWLPLPLPLEQKSSSGFRILDRDGQLMARTMTDDQVFHAPITLEEAGPVMVSAIVAAEDKRFHSHGGVDPVAILRAAVQVLSHGRIVSGASTLTQQLARTTFDRPRTLAGKWHEMALALRIEREMSKEQILEQYLNRVHFGPQIVGVRAAADHYFGKAVDSLDLSEAATLAGLVRGPTLYDPRVRPELARVRRDRVLSRMAAAGFIREGEHARARSMAVRVRPRAPLRGAHHWVRMIGEEAVASNATPSRVLRTTLSGGLQTQVEAIIAAREAELDQSGVTAASAIVIDNETGDVLAYVGAPDFFDSRDGGQNDGVAALRQPGSTLKPFLYAQAIDELGLTAASLLPDDPTVFRTNDAFYSPQNFDRKFRGAVRLRRALANSLNVPAVAVLEKLGPARVLAQLRNVGLTSLNRDAAHYGPALALGDGEVTLRELTTAYATLARGGRTLRARLFLDEPIEPGRRVFSAEACALISEMLSDDAARREVFGAHNALDLPFAVAVKTGTSKGYRDSWTVGYTRALTIGVWVGNFDGRPTQRVTGARGAGHLFHAITKAAVEVRGASTDAARHRPLHDVPLVQKPICTDSSCTRTLVEWFAVSPARGDDAKRASAFPELPLLEGAEPNPSEGAARAAQSSPASPPTVRYPAEGMSFRYDPAIGSARQRLILKADARGAEELQLFVDGAPLVTVDGRAEWPLTPGLHRVHARTATGMPGPVTTFSVN